MTMREGRILYYNNIAKDGSSHSVGPLAGVVDGKERSVLNLAKLGGALGTNSVPDRDIPTARYSGARGARLTPLTQISASNDLRHT